jgi:hypothetical protein
VIPHSRHDCLAAGRAKRRCILSHLGGQIDQRDDDAYPANEIAQIAE